MYIKKAVANIAREIEGLKIKTVITIGESGEVAGIALKHIWEILYPGRELEVYSVKKGVYRDGWQEDVVEEEVKALKLNSEPHELILLLDDVVETGKTMTLMKKELKKVGITNTFTAVLGHVKDGDKKAILASGRLDSGEYNFVAK